MTDTNAFVTPLDEFKTKHIELFDADPLPEPQQQWSVAS